jgi:hypothetical protein
LCNDYPGFRIEYLLGEDIRREDVVQLVRLDRSHCGRNYKEDLSDDRECERLYLYARLYGMLCLLTVDGAVIGGSLNFLFKNRAYGDILTHSHEWRRYDAGKLTAVNTFKYMIENGREVFHLLWGKEDYKRSFGACPLYLYDAIVFKGYAKWRCNRVLFSMRELLQQCKKRMEQVVILKRFYQMFLKRYE